MENYSAIKKNEIISCVSKCMALEVIMLRKINKTQTSLTYFLSYMDTIEA